MSPLSAFIVLLVCQLIGTAIQQAFALSIPGAVIGMLLLFACLVLRGKHDDGLGKTANLLLRYLPLLFVPAGVGVMNQFGLIAKEWLPITASLVLSLLATIAFTGIVMQVGLRLTDRRSKPKS